MNKHDNNLNFKNKPNAFTLAEVLITLGIIGIVATMTMPPLIQSHRETENVSRLLKFASILSQAVNLWKASTECTSDVSTCLNEIGLGDSQCKNFAPIAAKMNILSSAKRADDLNKIGWLPNKAYNYYGEEQTGDYGGVSKLTISDCAYLLNDGTIFSIDINPTNFDIIVDVNGKKLPNKVGNDIFFFTVGGNASLGGWSNTGVTKDIFPYPLGSGFNVYRGTCRIYSECNPENLNPSLNNGASPTSYVLLNKKLPNFKVSN